MRHKAILGFVGLCMLYLVAEVVFVRTAIHAQAASGTVTVGPSSTWTTSQAVKMATGGEPFRLTLARDRMTVITAETDPQTVLCLEALRSSIVWTGAGTIPTSEEKPMPARTCGTIEQWLAWAK